MPLTRRSFLGAAGLAATYPALSACGFSTGGGGSSPTGSDTITFTTWGTDAELAGFRSAIERFEAANDGATVRLNAVPYEQIFTNVDAQIQAGNPPDVFRVPYYSFGRYAGAGQLLDLSDLLESDFSDRFTPQAWSAVQNDDRPFGVPHHTDTSVILYNTQLLQDAGITEVPTSLEDAWTWDELGEVARRLRSSLPDDRYPMIYNWQGNGVTRWLSWLFEADGRFLDTDLVTPAIDSDAGAAAVDFTRSFFTEGWVPPNSSVKATTYAADTWFAQTAAMTWAGAFLLPDADSALDFEWGATFSPRRDRSAGDFGGNALVATADARQPELAAAFLSSITDEEPMRDFCQTASLLPTRADLTESGIEFDVRGDLSPVFVGQATTVLPEDSGQVASPSMSEIITVLQDQLERAFVGDQATAATLRNMSDGIARATGG